MIGLEEYKKHLIDVYRYEIDNNDMMKNNRKKYLSERYGDEYLGKIINDTYEIIKIIFDIKEYSYCNIKMNDYNIEYISLNLHGGWFSDRLYIDSNGYIISEYILKQVFGRSLMIFIREEEYYFDSGDPDIVSFDYQYFLSLQNFPDNMDEIKENILKKVNIKTKINKN